MSSWNSVRITATALAACFLFGSSWGWQQPVPLSSSFGRTGSISGGRPHPVGSRMGGTAVLPGSVLHSNRPGGGFGPRNDRPYANDPAFYDDQQQYGMGNYDEYYQEMGDRFDRQQQRNYRAFNGRDLNRDQIGSASHWSNSRQNNNPRSTFSGDHQTIGPDARWNTPDRRERADSFWSGRGGRGGGGGRPGMMPPPPGFDNGRLPQWGDRRAGGGGGGRSSTFWPNNNNRSNNNNRRSSSGFNNDNHETMGPAPEWDSAARRARASSFWDGERGNRSYRYQDGRGVGGGFMGGPPNQPYERRNMWRPQTNFYQPEFDSSMGYVDDLGRGLQNFNQRGWNPRSRRSDYETGITGPPSSEQFQKGINQQQTMGPKPASEYRRRLERERLKSGTNYYPQRNYYDQREDYPPYYEDFPERYPEQWGGEMYR